jgi:hypothetical protein
MKSNKRDEYTLNLLRDTEQKYRAEGKKLIQEGNTLVAKADSLKLAIAQFSKIIDPILDMPEDAPTSSKLEGRGRQLAEIPSSYSSNLSGPLKMLYVLTKARRFMHVRDIATEIVRLDVGGNINEQVEELSKRTGRLLEQGRVVKFGTGRYTVWGFPEWLDRDGSILPKYAAKTFF